MAFRRRRSFRRGRSSFRRGRRSFGRRRGVRGTMLRRLRIGHRM